MNSMNFYPGPSQLYSSIKEYMNNAFESGILSKNHRSVDFMHLMEACKRALSSKLNIPDSYKIAFVSSATEAWEISIQSLVQQKATIFHNGNFGQKWGSYAKNIKPESQSLPFALDGLPDLSQLDHETELVGMVQNETSNGTALPEMFMEKVRKSLPDQLIAYDVTSSIAGIELNWELGDFWFASVQKCFGLPSGMGIVIVSPAAAEKAQQESSSYYNSLKNILAHSAKNQTHYTPNILDIYLLTQVCKQLPSIQEQHKHIHNRKLQYSGKFADLGLFELVWNEVLNSDTVFCLSVPTEKIDSLKQSANAEGILLGNGYGKWKDTTIRIANFPAISDEEFNRLNEFFKNFMNP